MQYITLNLEYMWMLSYVSYQTLLVSPLLLHPQEIQTRLLAVYPL